MGYEFENIYKGTQEFPIGLFDEGVYIKDPHYHIEYELLYLSEGTVTFGLEKTEYTMKAGDVAFINPGINHYVRKINESDTYHYYAMLFDASVFGSQNETTRRLFDNVLINNKITLPDGILEKIKIARESLAQNNFGKEIELKNLLFEIFLQILNTKQFAPLPEKDNNCDNKSIENSFFFIKEHFKENIQLKDVLDNCHYSKSHFIKLFKKATNMNFTDYLNKFRVEKACRDLIYTKKNVTEIATENGFNNIQYFSKVFKKYMNCTPKQYQKKWRVSNR